MNDPFIGEIRRIRKQINRLIEANPEQHRKDLEAIRERYKDRIVYVTVPKRARKAFAGLKP
jgi:hypothetical protein